MTLVLSRSHTYDDSLKVTVGKLSGNRTGRLHLINLFIKAGYGRTSAYDTALRIIKDEPGAVVILYYKKLPISFEPEKDTEKDTEKDEEEKFIRLLDGKRVGYVEDPTPANIILLYDILCKIT